MEVDATRKSAEPPAPVASAAEVRRRLRGLEPELRELRLRRIGLFGSFVRGSVGTDSDVDLLVEFSPGEKSFDRFMDLAFLLEGVLRRRVELVTREALSPHFGPRILAEVQDVPLSTADILGGP